MKTHIRDGGTSTSFIGPEARGEGPCQIQTSSPESGAPIGPDPSRGPPAWAGNRLTPFPAKPSPTAGTLHSDSTRRHESPTPKSACESQANLHRVWTPCPRVNRPWTRGLPENLQDRPRILHRSRLWIPGVFALRSRVIVDRSLCQVKDGMLW